MSPRRHRCAVVLAGALLCAGCASPCRSARGRDLRDVFTVSVGLGLGAKTRVGPLQLPLVVQSDYAGLRCGELFCSPMREDFWTYVSEAGHVVDQPVPFYSRETLSLCSGYEIFDPGGAAAQRHKRVRSLGIGLATVDGDARNAAFYTQAECVLGVGVSARVGINLGELLDLFLGVAGVDLMSDDGAMEEKTWATN